MRCVAVDWSGARDAAKTIWIAEARAGELTVLENGRSREAVVAWLAERADDELVVGLDFAFSFPAWYSRDRGWRSGPDVWAGVGDELLEDRFPFWGRHSGRPPFTAEQPQRRADEQRLNAKSVFQIGGAGAVGTGSIRGMPHLLALRSAGFSVWPFDPPRRPLVVEIYPRALYRDERVVKRRPASRREALARWYPGLSPAWRELAEVSEDAFDAAVSALAMSAHEAELRELSSAPEASPEGRIWVPACSAAAR